MYERPADLTDAELAAALRRYWALDIPGVSYAAVGYGGYHWTATDATGTRWFATASRLASDEQFIRRVSIVLAQIPTVPIDDGFKSRQSAKLCLGSCGTQFVQLD